MGTVRRLMVVPVVGAEAVLLPEKCIRCRIVGGLFISTVEIWLLVILKIILKVKNQLDRRHWQTVSRRGEVRIR